MKTYTIEMTEREIRRFTHQLNNTIGLIGGSDGTVNALRDLRDKFEKTIADYKDFEDFYAVAIGDYMYWAGPDAETYSPNINAIQRFSDAESANKAIADNKLKGAAAHVIIPKKN